MTSTRLQRILDEIHALGLKVDHRQGYVQTQCPCHDDNNPSVTWKEQDSGKITVQCHAGCEAGDILKALGLNFGVLYPEDQRKTGKKQQSRIVATYPYRDEKDNVLFEAVRFHPKKFRQRVQQKDGSYSWSLKGVRRVIYNLPEVIEAVKEGKPIFLCEGEKDVEALGNRDLVATTVPMGAGKWLDSYNEFFKGADVIILPDNDDPGREHAVNVTENIIGIAKTVRILQLPGLKNKQDVSDWLMDGGTKDELLELAFNTDELSSKDDALAVVGMEGEQALDDSVRNLNNYFFEEDHKIYAMTDDQRLVADFAIDINSIVKDDRQGRIFYINIRERLRGKLRKTDTIEVLPESLDDVRSFYKAIRPYTMGEIIQKSRDHVKPLSIFKWLLSEFDKPIVRRPDHVGFIQSKDHNPRPYWLFGNALICPPFKEEPAKVIGPNEAEEFIVDEHTGFSLPLYESPKEKEQLVPMIKTDLDNAGEFLGEVKGKLLQLIGGGDPSGRAKNYAKILLAYVVYHLYEKQLYYANDMNGHTVMLYVYGPKGTGKTTYFNTFLRAFFGLHKTKELKGNSVTIAAIENQMGHFSQLPVCYDEYNPEISNASKSGIDYQNINGYYHKTSRTVSDVDRAGRNKFTPIRSTLSLTSNFRINLDVDQADATESRVIYFEYKKEYRSNDNELFEWFENNLDSLSRITTYILTNQTDEKRDQLKKNVRSLYTDLKDRLDKIVEADPKKYVAEHRLTDNYTRLLGCYELIFGEDPVFRKFVESELLTRFAAAKENEQENAVLSQLAYMASSGRIKHVWHYFYNNNSNELYINLGQIYESYVEFKRDKAVSNGQFKDILTEYLIECGGYEKGTKKWYGKYFDRHNDVVEVNKAMHSYIIRYDQLDETNQLKDIFMVPQESWEAVRKATESPKLYDNLQNLDNEEDIPF
ncbi:hypothetical protein [Gracilimonas tropica]|uniref:hypothetical protein n=1 Tax=Gracilimonas tropica TaxID=454600 RepID=UPI00037FCDF7|nr:hypothetical protein [Gracilimonas tropica]